MPYTTLPPPPLTGGQWKTLTERDRREKEHFLASEQRASQGFMTQANRQMELLHVMSDAEQIARCLSLPPLGKRTTAAVSDRITCQGFI